MNEGQNNFNEELNTNVDNSVDTSINDIPAPTQPKAPFTAEEPVRPSIDDPIKPVIEDPVTPAATSSIDNGNKKGNKGLIIIIIVLVALLLGAVGYIAYSNGWFGEKETETTSTEETKDNNTLINFDVTKCINGDLTKDGEAYDINFATATNAITFNHYYDETGKLDTKALEAYVIYSEVYGGNYKDYSGTTKEYDKIKISFDKKVVEVFPGVLSNNMGLVYFFLLEDGTVEYMRYSDIYQSQKFEKHALTEVKDIVKFDVIGNEAGSKIKTIAYKIDGTFYDLSKYDILKDDGISR